MIPHEHFHPISSDSCCAVESVCTEEEKSFTLFGGRGKMDTWSTYITIITIILIISRITSILLITVSISTSNQYQHNPTPRIALSVRSLLLAPSNAHTLGMAMQMLKMLIFAHILANIADICADAHHIFVQICSKWTVC